MFIHTAPDWASLQLTPITHFHLERSHTQIRGFRIQATIMKIVVKKSFLNKKEINPVATTWDVHPIHANEYEIPTDLLRDCSS